jgi:arylsulfatase A
VTRLVTRELANRQVFSRIDESLTITPIDSGGDWATRFEGRHRVRLRFSTGNEIQRSAISLQRMERLEDIMPNILGWNRHSKWIVAFLGLVSIAMCQANAEFSKSPNVVFILADDLGWGELGCYGQLKIPTPNIDRLASEGMRFTQHYSGAPVCAPSRCVLMTGKHLGHAEIRGNLQAKVKFPEFNEGQYPLSQGALTIAMLFEKAGYSTGAMGKWGLGPVGSSGAPDKKGIQYFFGYNCQSVAHSYFPSHLWRNDQRVTINEKPLPGHRKQPDGPVVLEDTVGQTYAPKLMIEEAEKFIDRNRNQPFFLYLPFIEPHVAMQPPVRSVNKFPIEWDTQEYRGESSYSAHPRPRAAYAAMISDLDSYVGRVLDAIDRIGAKERTLVIFTSDNGTTHAGPMGTKFHIGGADPAFFNSTAGLRAYKGSVYEGGIRVPMIARLPGVIPSGIVSHAPSYFADWFPTLCDAAKLSTPSDLDGQSLWPILTGSSSHWTVRKPMVWVFPEYGGQVAVRIGNMKAVRQGLKTKKPSDWEVYDLQQDVSESKDLASTQKEFLSQVENILRHQVGENSIFPLSIPGIN